MGCLKFIVMTNSSPRNIVNFNSNKRKADIALSTLETKKIQKADISVSLEGVKYNLIFSS